MGTAVEVTADVCARCEGTPPPPGKVCPECSSYTLKSTDPKQPARALLTVHAVRRAAERVGLNKSATERMANKAFAQGLRPKNCAGQLRAYLDSMALQHQTTPIIYGEFVWCFGGPRLVTVLSLPLELRKAAHATAAALKAVAL